MHTDYSVAAHWHGGFEEAALQAWAEGLRTKLLAPRVSLGLAGFFCNGEIGPVGDKNLLHGCTAVLALFVRK